MAVAARRFVFGILSSVVEPQRYSHGSRLVRQIPHAGAGAALGALYFAYCLLPCVLKLAAAAILLKVPHD